MPEGAERGIESQPDPGPWTIPSGKVFVSHASQDSAVAGAIVEALERAGISCWIAPRDVLAGEFYADAIVHAIDAAPVLILVLSQSAAASPHILREVERASSKRHPLIALRIDRAAMPAGLEYFLNTSQWLDAAEANPSRAFPKLIEAVRRVLSGAAPAPADPGAKPASSESALRFSARSRLIAWIAALLIVILAAVAIDKIRSSRRAESARTAMTTAPTLTELAFNPPPRSIAVLPFVNMSGDPKQEYFSDGITEELLNSLSRLNELQVVARTSSFSFKGQDVDVSTIAHKLNVGVILEGSVRRSGDTVRITAQLINTVTGFHLWSQTYDRKVTDILRVQSDVAATVARQLQIQLARDETARLELGSTSNPEAYEAYLRGVEALSRWDLGDAELHAALTEFDHAIALDPNYALAYSKRSVVFQDIAIFVAKPGDIASARNEARQAADRAVVLAPELGEAHLALAETRAYALLDFAGAAPEFDRALALSPGSARVQRGFAGFAALMGHSELAIFAARRALALDSQNVESHITLAQVLLKGRHYGDAVAAFRTAQVFRPNSIYVAFGIADALLASGQFEQARALCESVSIPPESDGRRLLLAIAYHGLARQQEAEHELDQVKAGHPGEASAEIAGVYAQWGDKAAALEMLMKAQQQRDSALQALRVAWQLDPIRSEPEFKAILARMHFPP